MTKFNCLLSIEVVMRSWFTAFSTVALALYPLAPAEAVYTGRDSSRLESRSGLESSKAKGFSKSTPAPKPLLPNSHVSTMVVLH